MLEFWSIESDGKGNFILYPAATLGLGVLVLPVFAGIKAFVVGGAEKVYKFAYDYTWIVMIVITVISIAISICVGKFFGKKLIHLTILFGISLMLSLSFIYSEVIFYIVEIGEQFKDGILIVLTGPIDFILMVLQMGITILLCAGIFIARSYNKIKNVNMFSTVVGIAVNLLLVYLFINSQLPVFLWNG